MKTILFLSVHTNLWGAERSLCSVAASLKDKYRVVILIRKHGDIETLLNQFALEYYVVPLVSAATMHRINLWRRFKHPFSLVYRQWGLERFLKCKHISPDLIYTNTLLPINGFLLSKKFRVPHICHIRDFFDEGLHFQTFIRRKELFSLYEKHCTKFICISDAIKKKFIPYFGKDKLVRIYNGIAPKDCCSHDFYSKDFRILFVGRLSLEKGVLDAIKAIAEIIKRGYLIYLDIYGNGPQEVSLKEMVNKNGLSPYIRFGGYASDIDYSTYHVGLMCSPYEGFGRVTVEYMMAGLPVIGTNTGATPEIIENDVTGLLYAAGDPIGLSEKILSYYKDRDMCVQHSIAGRKRAMAQFSEEQCIQRVGQLIEGFVSGYN